MEESMEDAEPMDCSHTEDNQPRDQGRPKYRGLAIIAIFNLFKHTLNNIYHTDEDKKLLEAGFRRLQYGVVTWDGAINMEEFLRRLREVSCDPIHEECETFAIVIMTHGNDKGQLDAYDKQFSREEVCNIFSAEKCGGLKDKLKLFIFHACCGRNVSQGVQSFKSSGKQRNKIPSTFVKHIEKDNLIVCSTFQGNVAVGPGNNGSFFVRTLTDLMEKEGKKIASERRHILSILRDVSHATASQNFRVWVMEDEQRVIKEKVKQQPALIMALHQLYYFNDKEEIPKETLETFVYPSVEEPL